MFIFCNPTKGTILLLSNIEVSSCCISVEFPSCCTSVHVRENSSCKPLFESSHVLYTYTIHGTNLIYFCDDTIQFLLDVLFTKVFWYYIWCQLFSFILFADVCMFSNGVAEQKLQKKLYEPNDERLANGFIYFLLSQTLHNTSTSYSYRYSFYSDQGRSWNLKRIRIQHLSLRCQKLNNLLLHLAELLVIIMSDGKV